MMSLDTRAFVLAEIQLVGDLDLIKSYRLKVVLLPCKSQHRAPAMKMSESTAVIANGVAAINLTRLKLDAVPVGPPRTVISGSLESSFLMNLDRGKTWSLADHK